MAERNAVTTEDVRDLVVWAAAQAPDIATEAEAKAVFDAWLAEHDRQVAERFVERLDRFAAMMIYDNGYPVRAVPWGSVLDAVAMARADAIAPAPECRDCGRGDGGCDRVVEVPAAPAVSAVQVEAAEAAALQVICDRMQDCYDGPDLIEMATAAVAEVIAALGVTVTDGGE